MLIQVYRDGRSSSLFCGFIPESGLKAEEKGKGFFKATEKLEIQGSFHR